MNPFMDVLSTSMNQEKAASPLQKFHAQLAKLERSALTGDISGWQKLHPTVTEKMTELNMSPEKELDFQVKLKQLEMSLMLKAGQRALRESKECEKKAADAQIEDNEEEASELFTRAQRLSRLSEQLHEQLRENLSL